MNLLQRGAKPRKKKNWEDVAWEADGATVNVEDTQFNREDRGASKAPYAPCPSPDAKWKGLQAVATMPGWNGSMKGVMGCLIAYANYYTGKCCPSEEWMAAKLECDPSTIKRAVASLEATPYLRVEHRSQASAKSQWESNAYIIGWQALIETCHRAFPSTDRGATLHEPGGHFCTAPGGKTAP
jgi:Helix-turn-helix domain